MNRYIKRIIATALSTVVLFSVLSAKEIDTKRDKFVESLISKMTLEEKVGQMCQYVGIEHIKEADAKKIAANNDSHAFYKDLPTDSLIEMVKRGEIGSFLHVVTAEEANKLQGYAMQSRLKIPIIIGIDAIHGNGLNVGATIYPTPIGMASSWNTDLVKQSSKETAIEMREMGAHWTFTPNIDIARDARWGRVGETFGEDTYLVSMMGKASIEGFEDNNLTVACAKHLVGGGESINGTNAAPTDISERTLRELHLPPYKIAAEIGVGTMMTAHNELNGVPCHANKMLMTDIVRGEYEWDGFYVSDWMDIERLSTLHRTAENQKEACFQTVMAGMDMHMHGPNFLEPVVELVNEGRIPESRIDESVRRILNVKYNLGLFDNPYTKTGDKTFSKAHKNTAKQLARESIVLLKNSDAILPLSSSYKRVMVTGPNSNNQTILGDWSTLQPEDNITTIYEGLKRVAPSGVTVDHIGIGQTDRFFDLDLNAMDKAVDKASDYDLIVVAVGENSIRQVNGARTCGENIDRASIALPGEQQQFVEKLVASGKPVVVVLVNGRPLGVEWISENCNALIEAWEPGSFGGDAVAELIYGEFNPSGKLPITIPRSSGSISAYYNYKPSTFFHPVVDQKRSPLYPFGFGLSYTSYSYSVPTIEGRDVTVTVKNSGDLDGKETVQLYIRDNFSQVTRPVMELKAFKQIELGANESTEVTFTITDNMLSYYNLDMEKVVEPGKFTIMVGGSSRKEDLKSVTLVVAK